MYTPSPIPTNVAALTAYVQSELQKIQATIQAELSRISEARNAVPARYQKNEIFLADGVNWNPAGTGFGFVYWTGSAWAALNTSNSTSTSGSASYIAVIGKGGNITGEVDAQDRPIINFASKHFNRFARYLFYGDNGSVGKTLEELKPKEVGAEKTTGKSLKVLIDRDLGNVDDDAVSNRYAINGNYIDSKNRPTLLRRILGLADVDADNLSLHSEVTDHIGGLNVPDLDFLAKVTGRTADRLIYTSTGTPTVDSLEPAEAGADKTASHQSATVADLTGHNQDDLPDSTTRFAAVTTNADETANATSKDTTNVNNYPSTEIASEARIGPYYRAHNLVANGDGSSGDNRNFSQYTFTSNFDHATSAPGSGYFSISGIPNEFIGKYAQDDYLAVDSRRSYYGETWARASNPLAYGYSCGFQPFTKDKGYMPPYFVCEFPGTITTLAVAASIGDTSLTLASAANWQNKNSFIIFNALTDFSDLPNSSGAQITSISGNVVTLTGIGQGIMTTAYPVGTPVAQTAVGGTYSYFIAVDGLTTQFKKFTGSLLPAPTDPTDQTKWDWEKYLPYGAAYIKWFFAQFRANPLASTIDVRGIRILTVANLDHEVEDGLTYARTLGTALTNGQVDIGNPGVIGKVLENLPSGLYTVATLPTGVSGMRSMVSDATVTTFATIVAGGGTNIAPVFYNGSNWIIG